METSGRKRAEATSYPSSSLVPTTRDAKRSHLSIFIPSSSTTSSSSAPVTCSRSVSKTLGYKMELGRKNGVFLYPRTAPFLLCIALYMLFWCLHKIIYSASFVKCYHRDGDCRTFFIQLGAEQVRRVEFYKQSNSLRSNVTPCILNGDSNSLQIPLREIQRIMMHFITGL